MPEQVSELASARQLIAAAAAALIDILDTFDGDADIEDLTNAEDEGIDPARQEGVGCPAADPGEVAWVEWDRMAPGSKRGPNLTGNIFGRVGEDDEDDDSSEDDDPDSEHDGREHEDAF
jgi:hypothetical protein